MPVAAIVATVGTGRCSMSARVWCSALRLADVIIELLLGCCDRSNPSRGARAAGSAVAGQTRVFVSSSSDANEAALAEQQPPAVEPARSMCAGVA